MPFEPLDPDHDTRERAANELREANERLIIAGIRLQELAEENERARRDAERSRASAEAASHAKDEFIASVSHELRTPLNAILGWIQLLRHTRVPSDTARHGLDVIDRNAHVLTRVIADLMQLSEIITGKLRIDLQPVDLAPLLAAGVDTLRPAPRAKEITLDLDLRPGADILGDPARLQQIFWNLLANAIKFTSPGGRVRVTFGRTGSDVEVRVSDTGTGIEPTFLPYVFERFRQEHGVVARAAGGLGLGLAIVRQLVELHGGTVRAESQGRDRGATFIVAFPVSAAAAGAGGGASSPDAAADSLRGLLLLVVEDDDDSRDLVAAVLEAHGARVITAGTCRDGLAGLEADRPDAIVADIGLPDEDGYAFIRQVRAREITPADRIPALALTARARPDDREQALTAGFQLHMIKPFDPARLVAEIHALAGPRVRRRVG